MEIKRIKAENYKTYKHLDLNLEVTDENRSLILVGGMNGCGKTTLFDAIYHALYGLSTGKKERGAKVKRIDKQQFDQLFNAGEKVVSGTKDKMITLEIEFAGNVLNQSVIYKLTRLYKLIGDDVRETVTLTMGGNQYSYGSGFPSTKNEENKATINKIIAANLPNELSTYFLFDAMEVSDSLKDNSGDISDLIQKNIDMVMGLGKFKALKDAAVALLEEKNTERQTDEKRRKEYAQLVQDKNIKKEAQEQLERSLRDKLNYADEHRDEYEQLRKGRTADEVTQTQIARLTDIIKTYDEAEKKYRQDADTMVKDIEVSVIYPKLASTIKSEVEIILSEKRAIAQAVGRQLDGNVLRSLVADTIEEMAKHYGLPAGIDVDYITSQIEMRRRQDAEVQDRFANLSERDLEVMSKLILQAYQNPFLALSTERNRLNEELNEMPRRREELKELQRKLGKNNYSFIEEYDKVLREIADIKDEISQTKDDIAGIEKKIKKYDFDTPQIPDPKYEMLKSMPGFFGAIYERLFESKRVSIEQLLRELLNKNLVIYRDMIGRVEMKKNETGRLMLAIYHKSGNEIYINQLNAGAKQTVMQVLLKVLYELGDYNPPVMIDTVMGVLDKESREVMLKEYFPNLAHQTILLSTDTEITTEHDFEKIKKYVAHAYTLHRDKEKQCTNVSEDYFGIITRNENAL